MIPEKLRTMQVRGYTGVVFNVVFSEADSQNDEPYVKFYDSRFTEPARWREFGQPVTSYYLSTLIKSDNHDRGLCLDGGIEAWSIGSGAHRDVVHRAVDVLVHLSKGGTE